MLFFVQYKVSFVHYSFQFRGLGPSRGCRERGGCLLQPVPGLLGSCWRWNCFVFTAMCRAWCCLEQRFRFSFSALHLTLWIKAYKESNLKKAGFDYLLIVGFPSPPNAVELSIPKPPNAGGLLRGSTYSKRYNVLMCFQWYLRITQYSHGNPVLPWWEGCVWRLVWGWGKYP